MKATLAFMLSGAAGGCVAGLGARPSTVLDRAAFELACPKEQLRSQQLGDERTMGVSGCGKRATYLYDYGRDQWLMNGAVIEDEPTPPGSVPSDGLNPPSSALREDTSGNSGGTTKP
jgi:hypothetical protein